VEFAAQPESRKLFDPSLRVGARVAAACLERGLIARPMPEGDILGLAPPLCLSLEEADEIVRIVKQGVDAVAHEVAAARQ
jgi:L-2,4-diaminobutyrate transaminase